MGNENGYFKLIRSEKGLSIRIFPPQANGEKVSYDEIIEYLNKNNIVNVDIVSLSKAVEDDSSKIKEVLLTLNKGYPVNEFMMLKFTDNNMTAVARFYPESNEGKEISKEEILSDLNNANVTYGIDEDNIDEFLLNRKYCTDYVIARGKPVTEGYDAKIEYFFSTDNKIRPKRNEDGSVDFHQLDNISHIKKDDILARLTPADAGRSGINVFGAKVVPRKVKRLSLKYGKNITLSEDGLSISSNVDGHVMIEGSKVFVSNTYEVPADVDNSTGDINYEGNVLVRGNVRTNFNIKASGDVEVYGVVEGASIIAGGQIILHHGIQGMSKGLLVSKGNIVARFIESSRVHSDGYIEADAIIQSHVAAKGDITVMGTKGNIIGGHVRSTSLIMAKVIGSPMGITTAVEVGVDPALQDKLADTKRQLADKSSEMKRIVQLAELFKKKSEAGQLDSEKQMIYKKTLEELAEFKNSIDFLQNQFEELTSQIAENSNSVIKVNQVIYPGTKVIVSSEIKLVNEELSHCRFKKQNGGVEILAL